MGFLAELGYFCKEDIIFSSQALTCESLILELVKQLRHAHRLSFDTARVAEAVMERERKLSTAVCQDVALPHIRTDLVEQFLLGVSLQRKGVDFNAADGRLTRIVILSIFPYNKGELALSFLASLSRFLLRAETRQELLAATDEQALHKLLRAGI